MRDAGKPRPGAVASRGGETSLGRGALSWAAPPGPPQTSGHPRHRCGCDGHHATPGACGEPAVWPAQLTPAGWGSSSGTGDLAPVLRLATL